MEFGIFALIVFGGGGLCGAVTLIVHIIDMWQETNAPYRSYNRKNKGDAAWYRAQNKVAPTIKELEEILNKTGCKASIITLPNGEIRAVEND